MESMDENSQTSVCLYHTRVEPILEKTSWRYSFDLSEHHIYERVNNEMTNSPYPCLSTLTFKASKSYFAIIIHNL